jgi:hypothetical protein
VRQLQLSDGRVSLQVSQLCLGTMYFGGRTDEPTSLAVLDRFLEAGGNFLDTANNYGQWHGPAGESERVIGRWRRSRGVTDEVVVATKVGARTLVPGDPSPAHWQGLGAKTIREDAETSLRQLGTDRLELDDAHIDDRSTPQEETVEAWPSWPRPARSGCWGQQPRHLADRAGPGHRPGPGTGPPTTACSRSKLPACPPRPGPAGDLRPPDQPRAALGWLSGARPRPSWARPRTRWCRPGSWAASGRSSRSWGPAPSPSSTSSWASSSCPGRRRPRAPEHGQPSHRRLTGLRRPDARPHLDAQAARGPPAPLHTTCMHYIQVHTIEGMALVQVRDVPEVTLNALKAQAAERGLTLTAYLRAELEKLAARPTNAEIVERLARRDRRGGPAVADTVAEIRRLRETS